MMRRCGGARNWQLCRQLGKTNFPVFKTIPTQAWNPPESARIRVAIGSAENGEISFTFGYLLRSRPTIAIKKNQMFKAGIA